MFKFRVLSGLVTMVAVLAIAVSPAFAEFEAKGQWKIPVKVTAGGEFIDASSTIIKCPANEIEATASVQSKGVINEHEKGTKQVQTKKGPHLNINVLKWGANCVITIGGGAKLAVKIKPCELQIVQAVGSLTATDGIVTACVVEAGGCILTEQEGKEKTAESNEGKNVGLKEIKLENKGVNLFTKTSLKGIEVEVKKTGVCTLTNNTNTTGELLGVEEEVEGINAV